MFFYYIALLCFHMPIIVYLPIIFLSAYYAVLSKFTTKGNKWDNVLAVSASYLIYHM